MILVINLFVNGQLFFYQLFASLMFDVLTCQLTSDSSKYITCHCINETTSNLIQHANSCSPSTSTTPTPTSNFNAGSFRYLVAAWTAHRARPHVIIEDEELCEIFVMLLSTIETHSCQTMTCNISNMCGRSHVAITHCLHIALNGWTSPNVFSFVSVTIQYFERGVIHGFVLDFVKYDHISCFIFSY